MPGSTATVACRVAAKRVLTRLGAWLGVAALLLQLLAPLSAPQAAWVEEGLFPPTCSAHGVTDAANTAVPSDCSQCPLCQISAGERLVPASRLEASVAYEAPVRLIRLAGSPTSIPDAAAIRPPLPSRGPPPAA
ncbi:MAG: hypothetical protein ACM31D_04035 [Bacteroidota bacterium]